MSDNAPTEPTYTLAEHELNALIDDACRYALREGRKLGLNDKHIAECAVYWAMAEMRKRQEGKT